MNQTSFLAIKGVCNTNCAFCNFYETKGTIDEKKHLEELIKQVEEFDKKGIKNINIGINGYEPTVFIYFLDVIKYIKNKGFHINLFTNWNKLADKDFVNKISKYIDKVSITIYSSNDEEHQIISQNTDSYILKHKAITNCLDFNIEIQLMILLLKPTLFSLENIFDQIIKYFSYDAFLKNIQLIAPSASMGLDRNKILIPPYTSIINCLNIVLKKYSKELLKNNIKVELNNVIPKCLFKNVNDDVLQFENNKIKGTNTKFQTSFIDNRVFFEKCNDCSYYDKCNGVEKDYIDIYGSSEIEMNSNLNNVCDLNVIKTSLSNLAKDFDSKGIWFDYKFLDKHAKEYKKILSIPKTILGYQIKDVLIYKNEAKKIKFLNDKEGDSFILDINFSNGKYKFYLLKGTKKNTKVYNLIILILYKKFNNN